LREGRQRERERDGEIGREREGEKEREYSDRPSQVRMRVSQKNVGFVLVKQRKSLLFDISLEPSFPFKSGSKEPSNYDSVILL
jgi:hypothetical protein